MGYQKVLVIWCLINVLLMWSSTSSPRSTTMAMAERYMKYKDENQAVEVRVEDLFSRMTLEEKIGQMTQIDRTVASFDVTNTYLIGTSSVPVCLLYSIDFFFYFGCE